MKRRTHFRVNFKNGLHSIFENNYEGWQDAEWLCGFKPQHEEYGHLEKDFYGFEYFELDE